jgi:hypothetical protein
MQKKIEKIVIRHMYDETPDLDWLGTFNSEAKHPFAINHRERSGDRNSYEFFNPQEGACETQEQAEADYKRMMEFERGNVYCLGIRAEAFIQTSGNGQIWLCNTVSSSGLWGIESDSEKSYFEEIANEEIAELKNLLIALGFSADEIKNTSITTEEL